MGAGESRMHTPLQKRTHPRIRMKTRTHRQVGKAANDTAPRTSNISEMRMHTHAHTRTPRSIL